MPGIMCDLAKNKDTNHRKGLIAGIMEFLPEGRTGIVREVLKLFFRCCLVNLTNRAAADFAAFLTLYDIADWRNRLNLNHISPLSL